MKRFLNKMLVFSLLTSASGVYASGSIFSVDYVKHSFNFLGHNVQQGFNFVDRNVQRTINVARQSFNAVGRHVSSSAKNHPYLSGIAAAVLAYEAGMRYWGLSNWTLSHAVFAAHKKVADKIKNLRPVQDHAAQDHVFMPIEVTTPLSESSASENSVSENSVKPVAKILTSSVSVETSEDILADGTTLVSVSSESSDVTPVSVSPVPTDVVTPGSDCSDSLEVTTPVASSSTKKIAPLTPERARLAIERQQIATFAKDYLIKEGLEEADLLDWESTIKRSREAISLDNDEVAMTNYFDELDAVYAFVKEALQQCHDAYGSCYVKENGIYVPRFDATADAFAHITSVNRQSKDLREKVMTVSRTAFSRSYLDAQPASASWVRAYIEDKEIKELFPQYKNFLKDFAACGSYEAFKKSHGVDYGLVIGDKQTFIKLIEQIERYDYQLSQKQLVVEEKSKKEAALQAKRDQLKECATAIRTEFPDTFSSLDSYKIAKSTSMQRTVLSVYAGVMESVLNMIIRDTEILLGVHKKITENQAKIASLNTILERLQNGLTAPGRLSGAALVTLCEGRLDEKDLKSLSGQIRAFNRKNNSDSGTNRASIIALLQKAVAQSSYVG